MILVVASHFTSMQAAEADRDDELGASAGVKG
jgi:hypothetical protein